MNVLNFNLTNNTYSSLNLYSDITSLKTIYSFLQTGNIGKSVLGNDIPYIKIGNGENEVFYSAAIHANEWITAPLLMKFVEDYCLAIVNNSTIYDYNARNLFEYTSLYIVPMCNPDGVDLVTGKIELDSATHNSVKQISNNYPSIPFPNGWKANIRGVDLKNYQPFCKVL